MLSHLKDYFTFSRTERRGSIVFTIIILLLLIVLYSLDYILPQKQTDFSAFQAEIDAFYAARALAQQEENDSLKEVYEKKYNKYQSAYKSYLKTENRNQGYHSFSPTKEAVEVKARAFELIELNTADTLELMKLSGIGKVFASRILKYRDMLGGFVSKEQLKEVYGLDSLVYQSIQPYISVNPEAIQKININFADAQVLGKHPYLKYDKAKSIIYYRKQAGSFESIEDIRNAVFLTDEQYDKLKPYLQL